MRKNLQEDLKEIKQENWEYLFSCIPQIVLGYIKSYFKYGKNNKITLRYKEILLEIIKVVKEENNYLNILLNHKNSLNISLAYNIIVNLDDVFDKTWEYFSKELIGVEEAYDTGLDYRATKGKKDFELITETDAFKRNIIFCLLNEDILKSFLNYPEDFWNFVAKRTLTIDFPSDEAKDLYGVNYKLDENGLLKDIKVLVPEIVNLEELLINIHEFDHAYRLYQYIHHQLPDIDYEALAKESEARFLKENFEPLYKRIFKK